MPETAKPIGNQENAAAPAGYERFLVLDGLRGVAAFAVILDHIASATLREWFPGRYLAVDFFFVLSGFVLAHAYGRRLGQPGIASGAGGEASLSILSFFRIRLIRLYPLYMLGLAIALIPPVYSMMRGWGGPTVNELVLIAAVGVLFIPAPPAFGWNDHLYPLNGPAWSLFFELIANVVYAAVAKFLTWRVFAIALPVLAATFAFTLMQYKEGDGGPWRWANFDEGLTRVLYEFFAGVAIYRLTRTVRLPALPAWVAVIALLAVFAVPAAGEWRQAFDAFAGIVLMPLLVTFVAGSKVKGLTARLCAGLGALSYGVYILHVPLLSLTELGLTTLKIELPYGFMLLILVALAAGIAAALAQRVYDEPFRRWLTATFPGGAKAGKSHLSAGEDG